jgi:hypothetical protein
MLDLKIRPSQAFIRNTFRYAFRSALAAAPFLLAACLSGTSPGKDEASGRTELSTALAVTLTKEAEDAVLSGAVKSTARAGYTGSGFADYITASGDYVRWSLSVAQAGKYTLRFRYGNGGTTSRPLAIKVNGTTVNASLAFPPSGSWTTWATVSLDANLAAGANSIQATAIGSSGANVDNLQVTGPVVSGGTTRQANLTWFTSYPDPGSEECIAYNGCQWAGQFAALDGKQPESWVKANNIAAVHERDFAKYKLKTLRLKQGTHQIDVKIYDMCSDADCDGCCTRNAAQTGFLIDVEKYTAERFGTNSGVVDWTCLDCN